MSMQDFINNAIQSWADLGAKFVPADSEMVDDSVDFNGGFELQVTHEYIALTQIIEEEDGPVFYDRGEWDTYSARRNPTPFFIMIRSIIEQHRPVIH